MSDERIYHQETRVLPSLPSINAAQTSSAATAQTYTITPSADQRVVIYDLEAYTSGGTATLSIESPSSTVVYQGKSAAINVTPWEMDCRTPRVFAKGVAVLVKITSAGGSDTSTLNVQAGILA